MLGLNVLVVEEEYLIATDIEQALRSAGAEAAVFRNIAELREQPALVERFDLAVIEAKLGQPEVISFAQDLQRAGVAVVVSSADRGIQNLFEGAVALDKPFATASLLAACRAARDRAAPADLS